MSLFKQSFIPNWLSMFYIMVRLMTKSCSNAGMINKATPSLVITLIGDHLGILGAILRLGAYGHIMLKH